MGMLNERKKKRFSLCSLYPTLVRHKTQNIQMLNRETASTGQERFPFLSMLQNTV